MTQPKNFGFGEDEKMLRESARKFFTDNSSPDQVFKLVAENPDPNRDIAAPWDQKLWQQMVELGWTAIAVPERAGGMGMPAVAAAALAEEAGKSAYVGPLLTTLCATYVLSKCETEQGDQCLGHILDGTAFTLAISDSDGLIAMNTGVTVSNDALNGEVKFVQDIQKADSFVVSAQHEDGAYRLYVISKDSKGVGIRADAIVDLTRDQGTLVLENVSIDEAVLVSDQGGAVLDKSEPMIATLIAADIAGACEWQLQTTTEYAKTREQFGRPIGFFQAVKHPLVDMMVMIDQTRGHVYNAASAWDTEPEEAAKFACMAKASAAETAIFCSNRSIQLHGGIGFTWECYLHLYFKRQMHNQMLFGDATYQRAKLADLLLGPVAA